MTMLLLQSGGAMRVVTLAAESAGWLAGALAALLAAWSCTVVCLIGTIFVSIGLVLGAISVPLLRALRRLGSGGPRLR